MSGNFGKVSTTGLMRWTLGLFILAFFLMCKKEEKVHVSVMPPIVNTEFHFRGYVTDAEEELVSQIHNFTRTLTRVDTLNGHPVYTYISNNQESTFYTDENGNVWEQTATDLGARVLKYGYSYRTPVVTRQWEILLKMDGGVGSQWETEFDTTFSALTMQGDEQNLRFVKKGKAKYEGYTETFVPEPYANVKVLEANWYELSTEIINETTGDTLFHTSGTAHHYFQPELGAVKYITDFTKSEIGEPQVSLRGTWELMRKQIPE